MTFVPATSKSLAQEESQRRAQAIGDPVIGDPSDLFDDAPPPLLFDDDNEFDLDPTNFNEGAERAPAQQESIISEVTIPVSPKMQGVQHVSPSSSPRSSSPSSPSNCLAKQIPLGHLLSIPQVTLDTNACSEAMNPPAAVSPRLCRKDSVRRQEEESSSFWPRPSDGNCGGNGDEVSAETVYRSLTTDQV